MLRKILATVALATIATGGLAAVSQSAANADTVYIPELGGTASLTVGDVHYTADGGCLETPVTVDVQVPDDYSYYSYDFTADYTGPTSLADFVSDSGVYSGTFDKTFLVCPEFDLPGSYTGALSVTFYDESFYPIAIANTTDAFHVYGYTAPGTRPTPAPVHHSASLATSKVRSGAHGWAVKALVKRDGRVWAGHRTTLQVKNHGRWTNVKAVWTNGAGRARLSVIPPRGRAHAYRVVSAAGSHVGAKVSRTYWLKRR
jgi:hypothetical protein